VEILQSKEFSEISKNNFAVLLQYILAQTAQHFRLKLQLSAFTY